MAVEMPWETVNSLRKKVSRRNIIPYHRLIFKFFSGTLEEGKTLGSYSIVSDDSVYLYVTHDQTTAPTVEKEDDAEADQKRRRKGLKNILFSHICAFSSAPPPHPPLSPQSTRSYDRG